jgi:streptogramin lyase
VGRVALGHQVDGVAVADDGGVWVVHHGRLSRVDPWTLRVTASVEARRPVTAVAAGAGAVWASAGTELLRVDPRSAQVVARLPVPTGGAPVAAPGSAAGVWAVCCGTDRTLGPPRLTRVDPDANRVVATIPLPGPADAVGAGLAGVWVRSPGGPVWRVDPDRNRLAATVRLPGRLGWTAGSVLVAGGMVLVTDPDHGTVQVLDRDRPAEGGFEAAGRDVAVDDRGMIWMHSDQRLLGFGPDHTRGRSLEETGGAIRALAAGHDALWVGAPAGLFRVDFAALP